MLSYHNKQELKDKYVKQMIMHRKAGQLIKGKYWENGKGCAIGCLVYSDSHKQVEDEVGIPEWLVGLISFLFESIPNGDEVEFPEKTLKAIPVGKDLMVVKRKFFLFLLNDICKNTEDKLVKQSIDDIRNLHTKVIEGKPPTVEAWESASESARFVAWAAASESAAWSASAASKSARAAASDSVKAAVESARVAAYKSAGWSTRSARYAARSAAESAAIKKIVDKLIKLLKDAANE